MLYTDNNSHYSLKKSILLCQPPIYVCVHWMTSPAPTTSANGCGTDHPISLFLFFLKREKELFDFVCVYVWVFSLLKRERASKCSNIMSMYTHVTRQLHSFACIWNRCVVMRWISTIYKVRIQHTSSLVLLTNHLYFMIDIRLNTQHEEKTLYLLHLRFPLSSSFIFFLFHLSTKLNHGSRFFPPLISQCKSPTDRTSVCVCARATDDKFSNNSLTHALSHYTFDKAIILFSCWRNKFL